MTVYPFHAGLIHGASIAMGSELVFSALSTLVEELERAIRKANREGIRAFEDKRYENIQAIAENIKKLESFQSRVVSLKVEWETHFAEIKQKNAKRSWSKQDSATPVAFHSACVERVSERLKVKFSKKSRSLFVSNNADTAIAVLVSKAYINGGQESCWFSFHPYQGEFLGSLPNRYLALGCTSPETVLLIPYSEFQAWTKKLNKTVREDGSFYWHIRVVLDGNRFQLKLEGRGNQIDITKYKI